MNHCNCPEDKRDTRCGGYPNSDYEFGCNQYSKGLGRDNVNWYCIYFKGTKYTYCDAQEQMSKMM